MNKELTPEENQVVNLLLFGCETEATIAHVLDTSTGDIEDRLLSIRTKWRVKSIEEILEKANVNGYAIYNNAMATRRITLDDLQFYTKFLGDRTLVAITGTREELEKGKGIPWKDIQWALGMANMIVSGQIGKNALEGYRRMILRLCSDNIVCDELLVIANKNQFTCRAN